VSYLTGGVGKNLIIVHGGGDGSRSWSQNAQELAKHYHLFIPDLPGFGQSQTKDNRFSIADSVEFIENFANSLGLDRFYLVGHSIGGGISLNYALKYPQKVTRLILISSWCLGKEIGLWIRYLSQPIFLNTLGNMIIPFFNIARWIADRLSFKNYSSPLVPIQLDMGRTLMGLKGQTQIMLDRLSELIMPTMIVWGAKDAIVPASQAFEAEPFIKRCEVKVFTECGHSVYKQNIPEFTRAIKIFLERRCS
jgi:pimeloyl-ACP methyl ester carboxylesterase